MKPFCLTNAYDSHVHWLETGCDKRRLSLHHLKRFSDIAELKPKPEHYRGDWLLGWGWDQSKCEEQDYPRRELLDQAFGLKTPTCFVRADGHAVWASSEALRRAGIGAASADPPGGKVLKDKQGVPTGILIDHAMEPLNQTIPPMSASEYEAALLAGMNTFLQAGFTHIRDLSCDEAQWNACLNLAQQKRLSIAVEQFFDAITPEHFGQALELACRARGATPPLVRVHGVKVYYDGALGSEGALLSQPYRCHGNGHGLALLRPDELREMMQATWATGLDIAVHTIGDAALDQISLVACDLWDKGYKGRLHLEHVEMAKPESLQRLKGRNVHCHMQPCHWLTDRIWLREKLGPLFANVFPWRLVEELAIPLDFGSDSPIEDSSLHSTFDALEDSRKAGVPALKGAWLSYHSHPDQTWTPETKTTWDRHHMQVTFLGKTVV